LKPTDLLICNTFIRASYQQKWPW